MSQANAFGTGSPGVHVTCPLCGADDAAVRWVTNLDASEVKDLYEAFRCTNNHYRCFGRIVRCRRCGMMYRDPQEEDLLAAYAAAVDEDYLMAWPARQATFERSLAQLQRFTRPPGKLLDVGCSTGFFLRVAQRAGWNAIGLEPSRWAAGLARAEGLDVVEGTLESHPFEKGQFDVVTLWDVIEHVQDPRGMLGAAFRLLRPGGIIALTTMDTGSAIARLLGVRWPHLMRMHLCYFARRHIVELVTSVGFELLRVHPHVRVLDAEYLASRLGFISDRTARVAGRLVRALRCGDWRVPICLGDLMALYARRPAVGGGGPDAG